jgi:hypothetical protein
MLQGVAQKTDCQAQLIADVAKSKAAIGEALSTRMEMPGGCGEKLHFTSTEVTEQQSGLVTPSSNPGEPSPSTSSESPKKLGDADKVSYFIIYIFNLFKNNQGLKNHMPRCN